MIGFLRVVIGLDRIKMKENKIKTVLGWLVFKEVKDVQKFLRLTNYYRQFIKYFTKIARLLHDLIRKE